jgi:hypothetical protein
MKTKPRIVIGVEVKTATIISGLCFVFIQNLPAQSADVFKSLANTQSKASVDLTVVNPATSALKTKPSRYAIGNIEEYTAALMVDYSMKNRSIDVFGLHQDTDVKPLNNTPNTTRKAPSHLPSVPLAEMIKDIKVSIVRMKDKSFLVGESFIKEGEEISISFKDGRAKNLKILKVESAVIIFKDLKSGEEAPLKIEILPFGMATGDDRLQPAGMVQPNKNEPLKLEIK